jgi:DNA-binding NtrC family response regulator
MAERILIVEDEAALCANVARALSQAGHSVTAVESGKRALEELESRSFDLVITDLRLPDVDGLTILDRVRASSPETVVLMMTAYASVDSAVEALRRGAHDYILKPLTLADLLLKVEHIASYRRLGRENARLRTLVKGGTEPIELLRRGGKAMGELVSLIERIAPSPSNVLVSGESGTGKEIVARALHDLSPRRDGPFVTLNVSAIPESLVESYLFGHERGAFTGADKRREGLFRAASGGTLFLDEIGELPLGVQSKLLRAVESKEILPVGSDRPFRVDARIIAATHRDLPAMVEAGQFRRDLLYRIQVVTVRIPPLRERADDIAALAAHFAEKHAREQRKPIPAIAPAALELLRRYRWPGNARELSNVIERAVLLAQGHCIEADDLAAELHAGHGPPPANADRSGALLTLAQAVEAAEAAQIKRALAAAGGSREEAARMLGLSLATLYRHLQRLGLKGFRPQDAEA